MKLSIIMPVYNENATIEEIVKRVLKVKINKELIIVDDGSKDGTRERIALLARKNRNALRVFYHERNLGKGAAVRTGIKEAKGDMIIIQDADLEYSPEDYPLLIKPIIEGRADVVYGTRFYGTHRVFMFWHYLANKFLSLVTNLLYNTMLTDMETCYKAFRADVLKSITLKSNKFDFEPEITAKVFKKKGLRIFETPISYAGRSYAEGKKIGAKDAVQALWALLKYRFMD